MKKILLIFLSITIAMSFVACGKDSQKLTSVAPNLKGLAADEITEITLNNRPIGVSPEYDYPTIVKIADSEFFTEFVNIIETAMVEIDSEFRCGGSNLDITIKLKGGSEKVLLVSQGKIRGTNWLINSKSWRDITSKATDITANNIECIRTDGYHDGAVYPIITTIKSTAELNEYYQTHKEFYDFDSGSSSFANTVEMFDGSYFENAFLLFIVVEAESGSSRHKVKSIETVGTETKLDIEVISRNGNTADAMAQWHIIIGLSNNLKGNTFDITMNKGK